MIYTYACPKCGRTTQDNNDIWLYECRCGHVFCQKCGYVCSECGNLSPKSVGYVVSRSKYKTFEECSMDVVTPEFLQTKQKNLKLAQLQGHLRDIGDKLDGISSELEDQGDDFHKTFWKRLRDE